MEPDIPPTPDMSTRSRERPGGRNQVSLSPMGPASSSTPSSAVAHRRSRMPPRADSDDDAATGTPRRTHAAQLDKLPLRLSSQNSPSAASDASARDNDKDIILAARDQPASPTAATSPNAAARRSDHHDSAPAASGHDKSAKTVGRVASPAGSAASSDAPRNFDIELVHVQEMFPHLKHSDLLQALVDADNLTQAIETLLDSDAQAGAEAQSGALAKSRSARERRAGRAAGHPSGTSHRASQPQPTAALHHSGSSTTKSQKLSSQRPQATPNTASTVSSGVSSRSDIEEESGLVAGKDLLHGTPATAAAVASSGTMHDDGDSSGIRSGPRSPTDHLSGPEDGASHSSEDVLLQSVTTYARSPKQSSASNRPAPSAVPAKRAKHERNGRGHEEEGAEEEEEEAEATDGGSMGDSDDEDEDSGARSEALQRSMVKWFNTCTREQMLLLPRLKPSKADALIARRPFRSYAALVETVEVMPGLPTSILDACEEYLEDQEVSQRLLSKCDSISRSMRRAFGLSEDSLECRALSQDEINRSTLVQSQPASLNPELSLKPYQLTGLNWLATLDKNNINAILADEMGLGKTVQAVAFLAYLLDHGNDGPHIIVVPPSTHDNWVRELERWCPSLKLVFYEGSQREREAVRYSIDRGRLKFNVLLTTYSIGVSTAEDRAFLRRTRFHTVILDEGHMVKNMKSQRYQQLMKINARRRILLTGTPLQNSLLELMSLLSFVMPKLFHERLAVLQRIFSKSNNEELVSGSHDRLLNQARQIMAPFVLRRLKADVLLQLPKKVAKVILCPMRPFQREQYNRVVADFRRMAGSGGLGPNSTNIFMQLRKMANHPLLHRCRYSDAKLITMSQEILKDRKYAECDPNVVLEDMSVMSDFELDRLAASSPALKSHVLPDDALYDCGKFDKLQELLAEKQQNGDRMLLFSQFTMMLDIIEPFLQRLNIKYLRMDGTTPVKERQSMIDEYTENDEIFVFLLSTRAGGLGINLTAANVVVIFDIDFNPHNDKQAEDRCHRVGQTRTVEVFRLLSEGTVEQLMFKRAQQKLILERKVNKPGAEEEDDEGVLEIMQTILRGGDLEASQMALHTIDDDEDDSGAAAAATGAAAQANDGQAITIQDESDG